MKAALKNLLSKRAITIILVAVLMLSAINTFLIFEGTRSSMSTDSVNYDYVLSQDSNTYRLKNMLTGQVTDNPASASEFLNTALSEGKSVYLNSGTYALTDDVLVSNKLNAKIESDGATIMGNGHKIIIYGDDYTTSKYAIVSGLTLINATIRVENSFGTTITNTVFENTTIAIEFINTNTWSEYNKIENCQFINFTEGIVFRTPIFNTTSAAENATGSYASSIIERCSFNLQDFSVGIKVETYAELSDSQVQDVRFWLGENDHRANQTAILVDGAMTQTLLFGVVFESFTPYPVYLFGIHLGANCKAAPILDGGVSFLGNWTARVYNPHGVWIAGVASLFNRQDAPVPVGLNNQFSENISIEMHPMKIYNFKPEISVSGSFLNNETVTVRVRIEYIDNVVSNPVTRVFTSSGSVWLSDDEMLRLFPSESVVWAVLIDAKSSLVSTDASVLVSGYGNVG